MALLMQFERLRELAIDRWWRPRPPMAAEIHLREAVEWMYRAQDAGTDRGVCHSYVIGKGWARSYPETTGYIIPTLLNFARASGEPGPRSRALEMADWEITVQLPNGGIPALNTGLPVIFDTGQVLFGWLAAYRETGDARYRDAAIRGADWLLSAMDGDGIWIDDGAPAVGPVVYNVRTAWALTEASRVLGAVEYAEGAMKFLAWSLTQEKGPGWFDRNCLNHFDRPLLHTIAYTAEGMLESGLLLHEPHLVDAAIRTARSLACAVGPDGRMAGRFDRAWTPRASWVCLTGMAQSIVLWRRIAAANGDPGFDGAARGATAFLLSVHDVTSKRGTLRGGLRGSFPVDGEYCRWRLPNWATKFLIDALLPYGKDARYPG